MSRSYKVAIVLAVLLCAAVVFYHTMQSNNPGDTPLAIEPPPEPLQPQHPSANQASAKQNLDEVDDLAKPGLGGLMTRIRSPIDTNEEESSDTENSPTDDSSPTSISTTAEPAQEADDQALTDNHTEPDTTEPQEEETETEVPTITFGRATPMVVDVPEKELSEPSPPDDLAPRSIKIVRDSPPTATKDNHKPADKKTYMVLSGDTFSTIAVKVYGSEQHWIDIAMANPFVDPKRMYVGQILKLPNIKDVAGDPTQQASDAPGQTVTHIVRPGETLSSIAKRYYNNPDRWREVFDHNRETIGRDPDSLQAGAMLKIPLTPDHSP